MSDSSLWIFGYGSLVWRPDFPHRRSLPGSIRGWARRFWQGSTDHRGLPERPGRVVTLLPSNHPDLELETSPRAASNDVEERCWGRAYEVSSEDREAVLALLDHRERGGYERIEIEIELSVRPHLGDEGGAADESLAGGRGREGRNRSGLLYIAAQSNPNYLGPASIESIADEVARAVGPSGPNPEYVFELASSLRAMNARDPHVFALEAALRERLRRERR